jgi:hypothetical protein
MPRNFLLRASIIQDQYRFPCNILHEVHEVLDAINRYRMAFAMHKISYSFTHAYANGMEQTSCPGIICGYFMLNSISIPQEERCLVPYIIRVSNSMAFEDLEHNCQMTCPQPHRIIATTTATQQHRQQTTAAALTKKTNKPINQDVVLGADPT